MNNRKRYSIGDIYNNRFYQLPKFLFEPEFKDLSNNTRILYALLRDRHELSIKNDWFNDKGEVYLIYTRKNMQEILGLAYKTVKKAIDQLVEYGLMEEERMGLNKANRIYLTSVSHNSKGVGKNTTPETDKLPVQNGQLSNSIDGDSTIHECPDLPPNNTNSNLTSISDTESSQSTLSIYDRSNDYNQIHQYFHQKLSLDELKSTKTYDCPLIDEILNNIIDMYYSDSLTVNGARKDKAVIRGLLSRITFWHLQEVINRFKSLNTPITNSKSYIQSMIYNIVLDNKLTIENQVRSNNPIMK